MTLSIAWVRKTGPTPELIFASDSRLTGGGNVDHCQKVFSLPREDCCISFAGQTFIAYPFILQLQNTILEYKKLLDRALDVNDLKGIVLALLNRFIRAHEGTDQDDFEGDLKTTSFLFGGWSWKQSRFYIWRLFYDAIQKRYVATGQWGAMEPALIGDYQGHFARRLRYLLRHKIEEAHNTGAIVTLDYEPLMVLADMLTNAEYTDRKGELKGCIGGGPQVMKVYPFLRTLPYAVEWNDKGKFVYVLRGRVMQHYERFTVPAINPFKGLVQTPVKGDMVSSLAQSANLMPFIDSEDVIQEQE